MPKSHVVIKTYHTGTAYPEAVFSSKKKAQAYIDEYAAMDEKAGWAVTKQMESYGASKVLLTTISNDIPMSTICFHVSSHEVQ
jgi:uncharacterized protein VirK/YbjX